MIIVGEKEVNDKSISVRRKFSGDMGSLKLDAFIDSINEEIHNRSI